MSQKVSKLKIWSADLDDQPGSVSEKLDALAAAGANLEFVFARRRPESPGKGLIYVSPIKGKKQTDAARAAYFTETSELAVLKVEGSNRPGLAHRMTEAVAKAGINLRGLTATVFGSKYVAFLAFDTYNDAERGFKEIRKVK